MFMTHMTHSYDSFLLQDFLCMVKVATMLFEMLFLRLEMLETVFISTSTMVFQHQIAIMTGKYIGRLNSEKFQIFHF